MIPLYASLYEFVFANQTLIFIPFEMYVVIYECNLSSIEERATAATWVDDDEVADNVEATGVYFNERNLSECLWKKQIRQHQTKSIPEI